MICCGIVVVVVLGGIVVVVEKVGSEVVFDELVVPKVVEMVLEEK